MPSFTAVNARGEFQTPPPDVSSAVRNDAEAEESAARPGRMLRPGSHETADDAFLALCDTYLANDKLRTMQASATAVIKRYDDGDLTANQLADFMSAFYKAIGDHQDASQEQVAWLSSVERKKDHWKKLGYAQYDDYLAAIDPHGKARGATDDAHKQTVRRKTNSINAVHDCWPGSPELLELVAANEGEGKWMSLASLAKVTNGAPEVAKYCLNQAILTRIRCGKTGRGATKCFIGPDFVAAKKIAETIDRAARPWDKEEYEGISDQGMKLYRGILWPRKKRCGKEDRYRTRQDAAAAPASEPPPTQRLAAGCQAAVDSSSSSAAPPVPQAKSLTVPAGNEPPQDHPAQEEPEHTPRLETQNGPNEFRSPSPHNAQCNVRTAISLSAKTDSQVCGSDVRQVSRSPQSASDWTSDPDRAQLRRQMGISADLDGKTQEQQSRDFRREVRRLAGIDFSKTWTELEREGKTEAMICSISPPTPPSSQFPTILIWCYKVWWTG